MRPLACLIAILVVSPSVIAQTGPSPEAVKQVDVRRKHLDAIGVWFNRPQVPLKDADVQKALQLLKEALASDDVHVFDAGVTDVLNGHYSTFAPESVLPLLLPRLKNPETELTRMRDQGLLMEHLAVRFGPKAKATLPDLLRFVADVKAASYLRGQAIDAAARIAPGDEKVVAAFIEAALNPVPKDSSGVHERIAQRLGDMGKAAWPAKKALMKIYERGPWYEDYAYIALGKLAMDDPPRPIEDYLDRLGKIDQISMEQAAAAFLHVQKYCDPSAPVVPPHIAALTPEQADLLHKVKKDDTKHSASARSGLLKVIENRPTADVHVRAALRTLSVVGPGSSSRVARVVVDVLTRERKPNDPDAREEASAVIALLMPGDKDAVPILAEGLDRLGKEQYRDWPRSRALAQVIARYGKDAKPAVPALIRAIERFKTPGQYPPYEELAACASALAAAGGNAPGARAVLLHLLDPQAPLLKKAGANAEAVQASLLLAVAGMGVPPPGEEREALLDRLRGALGSPTEWAFRAGAKSVSANADAFTDKEAATLVPLMSRTLAADFRFKASAPVSVPLSFTHEEGNLPGAGWSARALGSLRTRAVDALPALDALAGKQVKDVKGTFLPEPPMNQTIREARKAVAQIRAAKIQPP